MGSRAIYSVIENGETMYMYGQWAASHSMPFFLLDSVGRGTYDPDEDLHLAEKMAVSPVESEQYVEIVSSEWAKTMLQEFGSVANISMHVEIDMDKNTIRFEHNPLCYHQLPKDYSVAVDAGMAKYIDTMQGAKNSSYSFDEMADFRLHKAMKLASDVRTDAQGRPLNNAVLLTCANNKFRAYESDYAGTYHGAVNILSAFESENQGFKEKAPAGNTIAGLQYDHTYGKDLSSEDGNVVREIEIAEAIELMSGTEHPTQVTYDFDDKIFAIRLWEGDCYSDIRISFDDALQCRDWAVADMYDNLDATQHLENRLEDYISNYVPQQDIGMQMEM